MKKIVYLLHLLFLGTFSGCSYESELEKSIFVPDKEYPALPAYSEWGYNTFGAFYDRTPFISNDIQTPAKVVVSDSSASFVFDGQLGESNNYYSRYAEMTVTFTTDGFLPERYEDLIFLNDTTIDLKNPGWQVVVNKEGNDYEADILEGFIEFKRAQRLLVDKEQTEVILSGHFGFRAVVDDEPVTASNGRFDVGIGENNFFKWSE